MIKVVTRRIVESILGPLDKQTLSRILALEPSLQELVEAASWGSAGHVNGGAPTPLTGRAARLHAILAEAAPGP